MFFKHFLIGGVNHRSTTTIDGLNLRRVPESLGNTSLNLTHHRYLPGSLTFKFTLLLGTRDRN